MRDNFKKRFFELKRERVSLNRDFVNGLRLDRNEKVDDYDSEVFDEAVKCLLPSDLSAYPETDWFYVKLARFLGVDEKNIFLTQGSDGAIKHIIEMLCEEGQEIIVPTPTFAMYEVYAKMHNAVFVQLGYSGVSFELNLQKLYDSITDNTGILFLPNPNQPIDAILSSDIIEDIANKCLEKNIYLVVDEAYYIFSEQSSIDLIKKYKNVIILRTFSKAFGLAGARLGYIVSNETVIGYLEKGRLMVEANMLSLRFAAYFLDNYHHVLKYVSTIRESQKELHARLSLIGVKSYGKNCNFIFIDMLSQDRRDLIIKRLKDKNVYVRGGFIAPWNAFIRVSIGEMKKMEIFLEKFEESINELQ